MRGNKSGPEKQANDCDMLTHMLPFSREIERKFLNRVQLQAPYLDFTHKLSDIFSAFIQNNGMFP